MYFQVYNYLFSCKFLLASSLRSYRFKCSTLFKEKSSVFAGYFAGISLFLSILRDFFFFLLAYGIFVPQPGIEPGSTAVKAPNANHWTAREFPLHDSS